MYTRSRCGTAEFGRKYRVLLVWHLEHANADRAAALDQLQRQMGRLWGSLPFHKGVYRFKTWEQFESWKTNLMMRNSPARR